MANNDTSNEHNHKSQPIVEGSSCNGWISYIILACLKTNRYTEKIKPHRTSNHTVVMHIVAHTNVVDLCYRIMMSAVNICNAILISQTTPEVLKGIM